MPRNRTRGSAKVYNLRGAMVRSLADGAIAAGRREYVWDGTDTDGARVASGVYLVRYVFPAQDIDTTQKIVLTK